MSQTLDERGMLSEISRERLWDYVSTISKDERMSGSPEEREAMDYVASTLRSFDITVEEHQHKGLVSKPVTARLTVLGQSATDIDCITHAFAKSTRVEGEVVEVGRGSQSDYSADDVTGKIVLIRGLASPEPVMVAEQHGALGAIFINDHNLHQMIVTPIWGTPTPESVHHLPMIPVVSIRLDDGEGIKNQIQQGTITAQMETEVDTHWADLPVIVGTVRGVQEPDHFVMLAGHIDSWFNGAVDNAAANATTLECMRVLANHRGALRRGFRVVIWSGHSHGRYAGSTWYADHFWEELYDQCVAYVNVDSTGAMQATLYQEILAMPEAARLATDVIKDLTGQTAEVNRVGRAGDQSFWGIGIPSVYMSLSRVPAETAPELSATMGALTGRKKSGQAWFWHTEFDTIDKVDLDVLELDTKIYLATISRLIDRQVLPFDYVATVNEMLDAVAEYHARSGEFVSLEPVLERGRQLRDALQSLNQRIAEGGLSEQAVSEVNSALIDLGRLLVPLNYTEKGEFDHDLALHAPALPLLRTANYLASADAESDEFHYLSTQLVRRRNQVIFRLRQAQERVADVLASITEMNGAA